VNRKATIFQCRWAPIWIPPEIRLIQATFSKAQSINREIDRLKLHRPSLDAATSREGILIAVIYVGALTGLVIAAFLFASTI